MSDDGVRRRLATVGAAFVLYGLAARVVPAIAGVPSTDAVVALVGVGAVVLGGRRLLKRARETPDAHLAIPAVESRTAARVPGDGFDGDLADLDPAVRERLERTAVGAIRRHGDVDEATARERVERGDWTDDHTAAAFFSASVAPEASAAGGVRAALTGRSAEDPVEQATRAVGALAALVGSARGTLSTDGDGGRLPSLHGVGPSVPSLPDRDALGDRLLFWTGGPGSPAGTRRAGRARLADGGRATVDAVDGLLALPPVGATLDWTTGRWAGVGAVALVTAGAGAALQQPGLLVAGAVFGGVAALAAAERTGALPAADVAVERDLDEPETEPGDAVRVRVTVRNEGDDAVPDLRYVDGVPPALEVTDGSPRLDARLAPGEAVTAAYELRAETGTHEFAPGTVVVRTLLGERERVERVPTEDTVTCQVPRALGEIDPQAALRRQTGHVPTDAGGEGVEFYGTREYRRGDPVGLIDWHHYASTGELSTIQFRRERSTAVVVVVDARRQAYRASALGGRPAVRHAAEGAAMLASGLLDDGNLVGLTALSPADEELWVPPGAGRSHRVRLREALSTHPAVAPSPPDGVYVASAAVPRLRGRLGGRAEVLLVSPRTDDGIVATVESLLASDYPVTVVSPDVTATDSPGRLLAAVERELRVSRLRSAGAAVHEWDLDDGLALSLARGHASGSATSEAATTSPGSPDPSEERESDPSEERESDPSEERESDDTHGGRRPDRSPTRVGTVAALSAGTVAVAASALSGATAGAAVATAGLGAVWLGLRRDRRRLLDGGSLALAAGLLVAGVAGGGLVVLGAGAAAAVVARDAATDALERGRQVGSAASGRAEGVRTARTAGLAVLAVGSVVGLAVGAGGAVPTAALVALVAGAVAILLAVR